MNSTNQGLSPMLVALMSIATGLAVACNYYAQPLLDTIAHSFNLSVNQAGFIVTTAQLGYAAGLLLLVPLAATLAAPEKRGKVVGTVMSGLLLGILLARTVAGALAQLGDWRAVFWVASVLMVLMALALWRGLPRYRQTVELSYPQLLGSIFRLYAGSRVIRTRAIIGCLSFANFSVLWTSMAFLLAAPPFNYSEGEIGLLGLAGAAGALAARQAPCSPPALIIWLAGTAFVLPGRY